MIREEMNKDGAWFPVLQPVTFVPPSGERHAPSYIELQEDSDGFTHLAYYADIHASEPTAWLTRGHWEVTKIAGIDAVLGVVYYIATDTGDPNASPASAASAGSSAGDSTQRHLYSVHLNGAENHKLTPPRNDSGWNVAMYGRNDVPPFFNWTDPPPPAPPSDGTPSGPPVRRARRDIPATAPVSGAPPPPLPLPVQSFKDVGYYEAYFTPKCQYYILAYLGPNVPYSRVVRTEMRGGPVNGHDGMRVCVDNCF